MVCSVGSASRFALALLVEVLRSALRHRGTVASRSLPPARDTKDGPHELRAGPGGDHVGDVESRERVKRIGPAKLRRATWRR